MTVYLVRHAKAGSRSEWIGSDEARPLTKSGRRQAKALVQVLRDAEPKRILSSPYQRCTQTVEPLARHLGLEVEEVAELAEGEPPEPVVELIRAAGENDLVLCSHGDVIPDLIGHLRAHGLEVQGETDWRKGSTWIIEVNGGSPVRARALPPPDA